MAVRKALGITAAAQAISFWFGFASVVIVSRLLSPAEIGVFSVAVSVLGFAHIFREFGVSQYLVQAAEVGRAEFRAAFTVTLATSWLMALLLFLLRHPLAAFYQHEGIAEVLALVSLNFLVIPFGTPLLGLLKRELKFERLAGVSIAATLVQTLVTVAAAYAGQSYLSMAWGSLAMYLTNALLLNLSHPGQTLVLPTRHGLRDVLRFGSLASATSLIREVAVAAPDLVLGRTLGFADVAAYSRGVGLQKMLVLRIINVVRQVHFPTLANELRKGGDPTSLYYRASCLLSAVTVPLLGLLAVLSEPLILFVFGEQWRAAVEVGVFICIGRMFVAPYALAGMSLMAAGKVSSEFAAEAMALAVRLAVLLSSIWLPLGDVVRLLLLAYLFEAYTGHRALHRAFGIRFGSLLREIWKSLALLPLTVIGPLLLLQAARHAEVADAHRLALLVGGGLLGLLGWLLGVYWLNHPMKSEVQRLVLALRRRLPGAR